MKLVVDTNVIVSALIADSVTRALLLTIDDELVTPARLMHELERHDDLIAEKSGLTDAELEILQTELLAQLAFVPDEVLHAHREAAANELAEIDPDDVIFLATALAVDGVIWSDDGHFREQDSVAVLTTEDVLDEVRFDG